MHVVQKNEATQSATKKCVLAPTIRRIPAGDQKSFLLATR